MTDAVRLIVLPEALYDGETEQPLADRAIVIEGGRIRDVTAAARAPAGLWRTERRRPTGEPMD